MSAPLHSDDATSLLAAPFAIEEISFRPAVVSGNRALALATPKSSAIQDRLDAVLGVTGWQDEYECLPDGSVICRLKLLLSGEWITKMDVGSSNEGEDGDRRKNAFANALMRAAVKFGIGRYLGRLEPMWVDYDPQKKKFAKPPTLPENALPKKGK